MRIVGNPPEAPGLPAGTDLGFRGIYYQADSFTLSGTETITNGIFWVSENDLNFPGPPTPPPGVEWLVFSNLSGIPGSVIASGTSSESSTFYATGFGSDLTNQDGPQYPANYEADFSFGSLALGAGTYWLVLTEPDSLGAGWIDTASIGNGCCYMADPPDGTWLDRGSSLLDTDESVGNQLAFQLWNGDPAVPEPASILLIGGGLVALGLLPRRIRGRS